MNVEGGVNFPQPPPVATVESPGRVAYLLWNTFGTVDILAVVVKAAVQGMAHPGSMNALGRLSLGLFPTFLVPLIIASHILLFVRLIKGQGVARDLPPHRPHPQS